MSKSYKFALSLVCILILGCIALGVTYLFYDKDVSEESIVLVDGNLSINFLDGNLLKNQEANYDYTINFSVTNNGNDMASYSVNLVNVKNKNDNIKLLLTNKKSGAIISDIKMAKEDSEITKNIQIGSGETHHYNLNINYEELVTFEAVIKIMEEKNDIVTFAQTILKNNAVSSTTLTTVGEALALENEGLISDIDDAGTTYYFRGAVENNYVSFAGFSWRIVRINGDGTVKLILNNAIDTVQAYYKNADEGFNTYNNSNIKTYLTSWYDFNLAEYDEYISLDKYCNDYNRTNETDNVYSSYVRNVTNKIPTFNCLGKNVGVKIGLLTADEAIYAGALYQNSNNKFYLYNKDITNAWWTMTPATGTETALYPFIITTGGALENSVLGSYNRGVRPVINIIKEVEVTGAGTKDNPYKMVLQDK